MTVVVALTLVLLQASLHSCRTYHTATPKNDNETSKPVKLPSKLIQILESLDSPDAKITKIKELIPVYDDFPEFRVKSKKKHVFMPYQKKGKPLAYILKKTYVNKIVSDHTDESLDSFEDDKNNERIYKGKPTSFINKVYFPSSQNEKNPEKHRLYEYPKRNEIHFIVDGDVTDEPEINEYEQNNKNNTEIKQPAEVTDDLKEPIYQQPTDSPAEHKHVHHTHKHNNDNSEYKAEVVSNSGKVAAVVSEAEHKESNHYHHGHNPLDLQLFQSEIKSDDTDSNPEQIPQHQKVTEDKPIDATPKTDKIENELDHIQAINVHKHHHHPDPDVLSATTDDSHSLNIVTTKHGHHKPNLGEDNVIPKHDLIRHTIAHHTEDPHELVKIDADELHADKIDVGSDLNHKTVKSNQELVGDINATEQNSNEKEHLHSHSHSAHHHNYRKENVKVLDKYLSYLNDLDLVSPKTIIEKTLNLSNDNVVEANFNDSNPVSKENNDFNAADFNRILPGRTKLTVNKVASGDSKLDSHTSDYSASEYYSDEFGLNKSDDASSSSEPSSEFIDSVSDSNQDSTETHENSSTASSESENTSVYSNELVTKDSNSYSESNSEYNSKSLEYDSRLPSSQSESRPESNESDIFGIEELPSEVSNLVSESVELSSESGSTNLSDEPNFSQLNGNLESFESPSSELSNSGSIRSSEIALNSISGSDNSDSRSENDSKSDLSQSESEESAENVSVSKKLVKESSENQLNSTAILAPTILGESNSITNASNLNSKESYLEPTPTDLNLVSEVSYLSLDANITSSEGSSSIPSNLETVSESYPLNIESNASSNALLESFNSSSVATEESTSSSLVTASAVETLFPDLDHIVSSLMSFASSLKSVASNLESSALTLESVPGLESIASKLNSTASELVNDALNLESTAMSLKWGSGLPIALNPMASSTESIVRSNLSTDSSVNSNLESKTSNLESIPSIELSRPMENSLSSPPKFGAFYSTIQSSINNNVRGDVKKDCKDGPVLENKISNDKKAYSMSFVFNK